MHNSHVYPFNAIADSRRETKPLSISLGEGGVKFFIVYTVYIPKILSSTSKLACSQTYAVDALSKTDHAPAFQYAMSPSITANAMNEMYI